MSASLDSLAGHFTTATSEWNGIAASLASVLNLPDQQLLDEKPATQFILAWMYHAKMHLKSKGALFKRQKDPPLADEFTAAVALTLDAFLKTRGHPDCVKCEVTIARRRGAPRPDISVWSANGSLAASVECKTNLGWIRSRWMEHITERDDATAKWRPDCTSYWCVMTRKNWPAEAFLESELNGVRWFCLSQWGYAQLEHPLEALLNPIEPMFLGIHQDLSHTPAERVVE